MAQADVTTAEVSPAIMKLRDKVRSHALGMVMSRGAALARLRDAPAAVAGCPVAGRAGPGASRDP